MKQILVILTHIIFGIAIFLLFPRSYDVLPFEERPGTEYWELKTGSKIGFTKVANNSSQNKNPIIYLHGGPGGIVYDEIIDVLSPLSDSGHDLYFYDQIGSGHSARLDNISEYSVHRHQQDLKEIINKIGSKKVILIAQSWGALLAINYLQDYSESIEKIIISGPGPILPINNALKSIPPPDSLNLKEPKFNNQQGNQKTNSWRMKFVRTWATIFDSKIATDTEVDDFFTFLNQELSKSTYCDYSEEIKIAGGGGYYNHYMTVKSFAYANNKRSTLQLLDTPILIIRGQCDNQNWGYTKEYLDLFSNATFEFIDDAGHNLLNAKSEEYYNLIYSYLSDK